MRQQNVSEHGEYTASGYQDNGQFAGNSTSDPFSTFSHSSIATTPVIPEASATSAVEAQALTQPHFRRCRVRECRNPHCTLLSHQWYKPKSPVAGKSRFEGAASVILKTIHPMQRDWRILRDNLDGLPNLPIDDQLDPNFRALFHRFFDVVFEPLANTFRGPSVANMTDYKRRMLRVALDNKAYCMMLVSHSDTDVSRVNGAAQETEKTLALYTKSLTTFRNQLIHVHQSRDPFLVEIGLLIICMLCVHDLSYLRDKAVMMHWDGLQRLVALRGGLHCVTVSLAYTAAVDRACAVYLNQRPAFVNVANDLLNVPWNDWSKYGSALSNLQRQHTALYDPKVLNHCMQTSCLVEIWERSTRTNGTDKSQASSAGSISSEFAFYVRDRIDERFAVLHADWSNDSSMNKCLLWVSRIIEYRLTWANYFATLTVRLCEELIQTLQGSSVTRYWSTQPELMIWLLFATLVTPAKFEGREWAISRLRSLLNDKFVKKPWPSMWWSMQLDKLRTFIWCDDPTWCGHISHVCAELHRGNNTAKLLTMQLRTKDD